MINRFLAAVAAVATACVSIPSAEAALNHKVIAQKLHSLGITTVYGDCTKPTDSVPGTILGSYNSRTNHFCISDTVTDVDLLDEVVIHELAHVVQDCIGDGIASSDMGSITRYMSGGDSVHEEILDQGLIGTLLKRNKLEHVEKYTAHMPENVRYLEYEAYSLETSPLFVLKLLSKCGAN